MKVKGLIDEDFSNYKNPSMFISTIMCDLKCCIEQDLDLSICQNYPLYNSEIIDIPTDEIFSRFTNNYITESIVIGGLEPMLQFEEIYELILYFREHNCNCEFIIYTGYYKEEIIDKVNKLSELSNIIIKFGRYIHNDKHKYDTLLGIELASSNQYAERIC